MIIGIVAIDKNFAIGKDGKLPWHYPADLKFFKQTTTGNTVVMGWNTWQSIGKPLPYRYNIILSRKGKIHETFENVMLVPNKEAVLKLANNMGGDVFIIGGSQTFVTFADEIEKWLVTEVPIEVEGADTFMPRDFLACFEERDTMDLGGGLRVKTFQRK
jgi:dihydrofolate reductase